MGQAVLVPRRWVRPEVSELVITVLLGVALLGACGASSDARSAPPVLRVTSSVPVAPTTQPVVPVTAPAKAMRWSPKSGPRGSVVTVSGTGCDQSTVYISLYGPRGDPAGASATAAVKPDGTWSGGIVVPQNALVGHDYGFQATCGEKFTPEGYYDPRLLFHVVP